MKQLIYVAIGFVSALVLSLLIFGKEKVEENKHHWVPPAPQVLPPVQPKPVQPVQPQQQKIAKLLIVVEDNCEYCQKLKNDWKTGYPVPHEYLQNSQEVTNRWNITGTPTLIGLDPSGNEVDRRLGYYAKDIIEDWLK